MEGGSGGLLGRGRYWVLCEYRPHFATDPMLYRLPLQEAYRFAQAPRYLKHVGQGNQKKIKSIHLQSCDRRVRKFFAQIEFGVR